LWGWQDGELRVRLRAAPIEGRANDALRRLLARTLDLPVSAIEIAGGATSRTKRVRISGLSPEELRSRLALPARAGGDDARDDLQDKDRDQR
jgi:uncharacterized protein YggU (UPF0235/DUF167 family)